MTMGISREFRSTDVGAPILSYTNGTLINVLKAVCVNGYGSVLPLGWTIEFEGTNEIVFRMKGGTRKFIKIEDRNSTPYVAYISAYETMSSLYLGTGRVPAQGNDANLLKTASGTSTSLIPWIVIGDDAGIWILNRVYNPTYPDTTNNNGYGRFWSIGYIGDYNAWDVRNKWNFCMCLASGTANVFSASSPNLNYHFFAERPANFDRAPIRIGILGFSNNIIFGQSVYSSSSSKGPQTVGGAFIQSPIHIYENTTFGNGHNCILGSLPGIGEPMIEDEGTLYHNYSVDDYNVPFIESVDEEGNKSILLVGINSSNWYSYNTHRLIFNIGKGFRNAQ